MIYRIPENFTCLIHLGYSREYVYTMTKKFFSNKDKQISHPKQIEKTIIAYTRKCLRKIIRCLRTITYHICLAQILI